MKKKIKILQIKEQNLLSNFFLWLLGLNSKKATLLKRNFFFFFTLFPFFFLEPRGSSCKEIIIHVSLKDDNKLEEGILSHHYDRIISFKVNAEDTLEDIKPKILDNIIEKYKKEEIIETLINTYLSMENFVFSFQKINFITKHDEELLEKVPSGNLAGFGDYVYNDKEAYFTPYYINRDYLNYFQNPENPKKIKNLYSEEISKLQKEGMIDDDRNIVADKFRKTSDMIIDIKKYKIQEDEMKKPLFSLLNSAQWSTGDFYAVKDEYGQRALAKDQVIIKESDYFSLRIKVKIDRSKCAQIVFYTIGKEYDKNETKNFTVRIDALSKRMKISDLYQNYHKIYPKECNIYIKTKKGERLLDNDDGFLDAHYAFAIRIEEGDRILRKEDVSLKLKKKSNKNQFFFTVLLFIFVTKISILLIFSGFRALEEIASKISDQKKRKKKEKEKKVEKKSSFSKL